MAGEGHSFDTDGHPVADAAEVNIGSLPPVGVGEVGIMHKHTLVGEVSAGVDTVAEVFQVGLAVNGQGVGCRTGLVAIIGIEHDGASVIALAGNEVGRTMAVQRNQSAAHRDGVVPGGHAPSHTVGVGYGAVGMEIENRLILAGANRVEENSESGELCRYAAGVREAFQNGVVPCITNELGTEGGPSGEAHFGSEQRHRLAGEFVGHLLVEVAVLYITLIVAIYAAGSTGGAFHTHRGITVSGMAARRVEAHNTANVVGAGHGTEATCGIAVGDGAIIRHITYDTTAVVADGFEASFKETFGYGRGMQDNTHNTGHVTAAFEVGVRHTDILNLTTV